jgi:iron complex outermembrane receptor protein
VYLTWLISDELTITTGAENLFDEDYSDHLTGFNRVIGSEVSVGSRMLGQGVNFFSRLQYKW